MGKMEGIHTAAAPQPLPQFSQAVKYNGMVYCSGNVGFDPATKRLVDGTVKDRAVRTPLPFPNLTRKSRTVSADLRHRGKPSGTSRPSWKRPEAACATSSR